MSSIPAEVQARASRVRMLLMDVDGVLTDGTLWNVPAPDGTIFETKGFDSQDGIALQWLSKYDIIKGVISGRVSPATTERARQTKMTFVYQGHTEKIPLLEECFEKSGISSTDTCYVGDDLTDIVCFKRVGFAVATANAREEVKAAAHYVTEARGGQGAIREVCELILKSQGKWPEILKHYEAL
ncbi:MAG: HAD hydrolase family protein [Acidobacteria bacterium]|nr:HAD hydrolase family protein [Acidobacteriota bacterium]